MKKILTLLLPVLLYAVPTADQVRAWSEELAPFEIKVEKRQGSFCRDLESVVPVFTVAVPGAERGKGFEGYVVNIVGDQATSTGELIIDDHNRVCYADGDLFTLNLWQCIPGQSVDFFLVNRKKGRCAKAHIVPHPIEASQHGYHLALELGKPLSHCFVCIGSGFEPGEILQVVSRSCDEEMTYSLGVGEAGGFVNLMFPQVIGSNGGVCHLTVQGKRGEIEIEFPWGEALVDYAEKWIQQEDRLVQALQ